ncbi:MAG: squalene synthase HpnC [Alphaproteobacteria bacterium]|nr:squalene synthase HpnC [Alphaproteobacteria bacterium]
MSVEAPSGKGARDENFPVGSFLIARRLRPQVMAYYAFARAADDIADSSELAPADKVARLARFAAALEGRDDDPALAKPMALRAALARTDVPLRHGLDLLAAFTQDATKTRYADWSELMAYCELSANPVGRFLLDLHGEPRGLWPASDALCSALQVLNHLQDLQDDYMQLDRVYLPLAWLAEEGIGVETLAGKGSPPPLRRVIDRCLAETNRLLLRAVDLPLHLADRRLAMEAGAILRLAQRLARRLRERDPLAERVAPPRVSFLTQALIGAGYALLRKPIVA